MPLYDQITGVEPYR